MTIKNMQIKMATAYTIAKEELPFTKFQPLLHMQKCNGLSELTDTYANDMKCAEMIHCIDAVMKENLALKLKESKYISVIIDAGTDAAVQEVKAINICYVDQEKVVMKLLGLVELNHASADGTVQAIQAAIADAELEDYEYHLVGFCADGAAVNFGAKGGVQQKLRQSIPWLIFIWCLPHRLELTVMNMIKNCNMARSVMDMLDLLYKTYHYSPKSRRELRMIAEELHVQVRMPSRVKGTRWSPHIWRALMVLLRQNQNPEEPGQYAVVLNHMEHLATASPNADIKGRAINISKKMVSFEFLAYSMYILDVLDLISVLSLTLQSNSTILISAISAIQNCVTGIHTLGNQVLVGGHLSQFLQSVAAQSQNETLKFQNVNLKVNTSHRDGEGNFIHDLNAMPSSFRQSVNEASKLIVNGMRQRYGALIGDEEQQDEGPSEEVSCLKIFNHDLWPDNRNELFIFGNDKVSKLIEWFRSILESNGCHCQNVISQWGQLKTVVNNEFKDKTFGSLWELMLTKDPYKVNYENVLHLVKILLVLPTSSAQCERTISALNRIKTDVRSSLDPRTVECLIRISSEGLQNFKTEPYIKKWFEQKRIIKYKGWPSKTVCCDDENESE